MKKEPDEADQREDGSPEVASEALSLLVANIQETSDVVQKQIRVYEQKMKEEREHRNELNLDESNAGGDEHSLEEKYMLEMKEHQFGKRMLCINHIISYQIISDLIISYIISQHIRSNHIT